MPNLVALIYAVLIGYPLVALAFAMLARSRRRRVAILKREMFSDKKYQDINSQRIIEQSTRLHPRWQNAMNLAAPIALPALLLSVSVSLLLKGERQIADMEKEVINGKVEMQKIRAAIADFEGYKLSPDDAIWKDDRLWEAESEIFEIEMLQFPITLALTAISAILMLPLVLLAYGMHSLPSFFRFVAQRLAITLNVNRTA